MFKLSIKPAWIGGLALLIALAVAVKLAFAVAQFTPSASPIGYVAQDDVTNFNLKSGSEAVFRVNYEREFWTGNLFAYLANPEGQLGGNTSYWTNGSAADNIDAQNFDTGRLIATMKDDGSKVPFRWANLSLTQQSYLASSMSGAPAAIVDFLRGDHSNEIPANGKSLRHRVSAMGDIIHSRPFYVADGTNSTVFTGANDGMLHAIDANRDTGGKERWAYVPSMLLSKMKNLSVDPYVHDYYVDGQINIAFIASGTKRMLVGGLGAGGRGLYALDITDMTATDETAVANKVMWEISPTKLNYAAPTSANAYVNLGYTYGTMTIARLTDPADNVVKDAIILGNGYNDGGGLYSDCANATPNYANCGGNFAAYLYVINAATGQLISKIKAGPDGTALLPNGLSTPTAIDSSGDGAVDTVYAGDLNGTMWKFNLSTGTATALLVTSPAQAITGRPAVATHPSGGFMVNFGTGKMLSPNDANDTATYYAYGVWDGAPVSNTTLLAQTLEERAYTSGGVTTRVRRVVNAQTPDWTNGHNNGWRVGLPAGERLVGEGSFIENERFYFTGHNPTISTAIAGTDDGSNKNQPTPIKVAGDNWQMELNYLSGGAKNQVFLDLNGNAKIDDAADRITYIAGDTIPVTTPPTVAGSPIMTTDGIAVGKFITIGLLSQPILVQLSNLNDTLYNQNPDVVVPATPVDRGVAGGHFDVEFYYSTPATALITVTTAGQSAGYPATLGAITINGITVVPPLTVNDIPDGGGNTSLIAEMIRRKVTGGFTATRSGARITIKAPTGAAYNGMTVSIADGTSQSLIPTSPAVPTTALITFSGTTANADPGSVMAASLTGPASITMGGRTVSAAAITIGKAKSALNAVSAVVSAVGTGGTIRAYAGGYGITPTCAAATTASVCLVDTSTINNGASVSVGSISLPGSLTVTTTASAGGKAAVTSQSGYTNFKPALMSTAPTAFTGGSPGDTCNSGTSRCQFKTHEHEYDDLYNRTGINTPDPSNVIENLALAIPSTSTRFKVLVQNQYLSPAAKLHLGLTPLISPSRPYAFNVDYGYVPLKTYVTSATLDIASLPSYTRATLDSLTINLPVDAFSPKDWWGGVNGLAADIRVGLHPTEPRCVWASYSAANDGNMYQPVIPPVGVTASGNGSPGYSNGSAAFPLAATTPTTATGVRHNGALNLQVIDADTPNSEIEISVPGHPEYGYRVKSAFFANRVLAEYTMFFHTKHLNVCFGESNSPGDSSHPPPNPPTPWSKLPSPDNRPCVASPNLSQTDTQYVRNCNVAAPADIGTDPRIGNLGGGGGTITDVNIDNSIINVTTTTITYSNGLYATIKRTVNDDGSISIVTTDTSGNVTRQLIANPSGTVKKGGNERGTTAQNRRISWRELVAP
jgi:hypothetical protein